MVVFAHMVEPVGLLDTGKPKTWEGALGNSKGKPVVLEMSNLPPFLTPVENCCTQKLLLFKVRRSRSPFVPNAHTGSSFPHTNPSPPSALLRS